MKLERFHTASDYSYFIPVHLQYADRFVHRSSRFVIHITEIDAPSFNKRLFWEADNYCAKVAWMNSYMFTRGRDGAMDVSGCQAILFLHLRVICKSRPLYSVACQIPANISQNTVLFLHIFWFNAHLVVVRCYVLLDYHDRKLRQSQHLRVACVFFSLEKTRGRICWLTLVLWSEQPHWFDFAYISSTWFWWSTDDKNAYYYHQYRLESNRLKGSAPMDLLLI